MEAQDGSARRIASHAGGRGGHIEGAAHACHGCSCACACSLPAAACGWRCCGRLMLGARRRFSAPDAPVAADRSRVEWPPPPPPPQQQHARALSLLGLALASRGPLHVHISTAHGAPSSNRRPLSRACSPSAPSTARTGTPRPASCAVLPRLAGRSRQAPTRCCPNGLLHPHQGKQSRG
ncbi:hypothetical protein FA09DRAFT_245360 [Tilletiopsis washingtonensis]|uniref:Uncharacterized protein n=1 Tax=Tilletiopsis washingtonensis TaxID=58919 RepID=A0A316ZDT1_9BASI|nr:hypothetical protein FA09DRAFT_245360 [Tilletiopsis washingtonensis]PWN99208.1 hypothetical protein FA09DRAFT_245360 [Tilletiopsis washingtonensis]